MTGANWLLTRTLVSLAVVVLLAAVWRHYQPPDRAAAFPAGEDPHWRRRQLTRPSPLMTRAL